MDPIPTDWYPLYVAAILNKGTTKNGIPEVRIRVKPSEGPQSKKNAMLNVYLGASKFNTSQDDSGEWVQTARTKEEYTQKRNTTNAIMLGFLNAMGVKRGKATGKGVDLIFNYWNVAEWKGATLMGRLQVDANGRHRLTTTAPMDDPKKGVGVWRKNTLPKQVKRAGVGASVAKKGNSGSGGGI